MKKLPYGISNYERLVEDEKLEEISQIRDLRKYTIVTVLYKMYVEEIRSIN